MKRLFLLTLLLLLIPVLTFSQYELRKENLSKAILFEFAKDNNFSVSSYNGGVGMKYYLSDEWAMRGSLGFSMSQKDSKFVNNFTSITFGMFNDFGNKPEVRPYLGGQLQYKYTGDESMYGISGVLGVEFFCWKNVSLGADYFITFMNNITKNTSSIDMTSGQIILALYY